MKRLGLFLILCALLPASGFAAGNAPQPSICNRACWSARSPTSYTYMSSLTRAVIHHTASSSDYNTTSLSTSAAKVRAIQNYHMDTNGWSDIGYNFLTDKLGNNFEGRYNSLTQRTKGAHDAVNTNSFGFNILGYYHSPYNNTPTTAGLNAQAALIAWRMPNPFTGYGSGTYNGKTVGYLCGHRDANPTACPGDLYYAYIGTNFNGGWMRNAINALIVGQQTPPWRATYVSDTLPASIQANTTQVVAVTFKNDGANSWDTTNTRMGTSNSRDRSSAFYVDYNWIGANRPTTVDYGTAPGSSSGFSFVAKGAATAGHYSEAFELLQESTAWFEESGDNITWFVTVCTGGNVQIEAEDYNHGASGTAYYDADAGNSGGVYRADNVDIEACSEGGYNVGWIAAGEWLKYSNIAGNGGSYDTTLRVAAPATGGAFYVEVNGVNVSGTINVPATGGYQTWATVNAGTATLGTGANTIRIVVTGGAFNLNWIKFGIPAPTATPSPSPSPSPSPTPSPSPSPSPTPSPSPSPTPSPTPDLPPAPPTGLAATAGEAEVALDWNDNAEGDLSGYNVYRSETQGGAYTKLNASVVAASAYTDSTAVNFTTYYYVVRAVDVAQNESANSAEVSAMPEDETPPAAPTGLVAVAGIGQVSLDWNDNTEPDFGSYYVYRSETQGGPYDNINGSLTSSDYVDASVTNGVTYYYVVVAADNTPNENESGYSNEASATPYQPTPSPSPSPTPSPSPSPTPSLTPSPTPTLTPSPTPSPTTTPAYPTADVPVDYMEFADEAALDARWGTSGNWTAGTLQTSGGADGSAKWVQFSDAGWSADIHASYSGVITVPVAGQYKMAFSYKNGHIDNPQNNLAVTVKDGSDNVKATINLGSGVVANWTYVESAYFALSAGDTVKIDITGSYSGTLAQKCGFDQFILKALKPTNVDLFEGYADEAALDAKWGASANWSSGALMTSGGAKSTAKWIEISDAGWSADLHATFSAIAPETRNYILGFYYKNGHAASPQAGLTLTVKDGADTEKAVVSLGSATVSAWTYAESGSFALNAGDTVKLDMTGLYSGTLSQKCAFDEIILIPLY